MSEALREFFHTEWSAMTRVDWTGLVIVLVLTALMIGLYVWVFSPKNRDRLEQHRDFVNRVADEEDDFRREVDHGKAR